MKEVTNNRAMAQVRRTAARYNLDLDIHLAKGNAGEVYCPRCKVYKGKENFPPTRYNLAFVRLCYTCRGTEPEPEGWRGDNPYLAGKKFGPMVAAARKLGIPIIEYLTHVQNNERWCSLHKGWFDASGLLTRRSDKTIRLCLKCAAQKTREYNNRVQNIPIANASHKSPHRKS